MQLDFRYELKDFTVKCKYRDTIISNKVRTDKSYSGYKLSSYARPIKDILN